MNIPRVLALTGDETGCSMWRVWQPYAELEKHGLVAEWCHKDDSIKILPWIAAGRYNIVVTPRIVWPYKGAGDPWVRTIHKAGLAWIYEVDDDVYSPRIVDRQIRLFESEAKKGREQLEWERQERIRFLSIVDGVTVSTERLATIVRAYAPETTPVFVVPNLIDANWFRATLRGCQRIVPPLTIGWAGGTREDVDILPIAEAWSVLAKKYPHVTFVVQGHIPEQLANAVPKDRRMTLPWLPLEEYPRALLNIDIGCCPLAPTVFNTSKSAIKWYEMTLAGAACVVSPSVYGREVEDGVTGLVAQTASEWVAQLSRLVEDELLRKRLRKNARRVIVKDHGLQAHWWQWVDAWQQVLEVYAARPKIALPA